MTVHCPHCATGYLLPDHLVGPRGSRVRCPECAGAFVVIPENGHAVLDPPRGPSADPAPAPAAEDPATVATDVLEALAGNLGEALERARAEGRLLSRHGSHIVAAYDEYRRRAGAEADLAPFHNALRERLGLDLTPPRA